MKKKIRKLFNLKNPYDNDTSDYLFFNALKDTAESFYKESKEYKTMLDEEKFSFAAFQSIKDIAKLPPIPTAFLKRNSLSIEHNSIVEITSSGTSGKATHVKYSFFELFQMLKMAIRLGKKHRLFSFRPTHYIILGYQPTKHNQMVISKTAYLSTLYAFPVSRRYALNYQNGEYQLDLDNLIERMVYLSKKKVPVRLIGFPSYTYFLLEEMEKRNVTLTLPKKSKILFGGGWKQFSGDEVSKEAMAEKVYKVLGVPENEIHDFFGAAEHPILYCSCPNHRFHVPTYARVIIRDVSTLEPLDYEQTGILNLVTPIHSDIPLLSILTDDLAVMRKGVECGCGIETDTIEILGRVGVQDVKTCSVGAQEYLEGDQ